MGAEQLRNGHGAPVGDVLAGVEHEQRGPLAGDHGKGVEAGEVAGTGGQIAEPDPAGMGAGPGMGVRVRQPGLADPRRAGERD
ncbi:hypothetical protein GCM10009525_78160 [Streptosporangium amethystogenes subsp. fukuiense]